MTEVAFTILIALFILFFLIPAFRHQMRNSARRRLIQQMERKRNSRVITLIHRQERLSLLGIPLVRFIDVEDAVQILRAIRLTPDERPIDLIVHSPGGMFLAAQQIAYALKQHPAHVTVIVPHYAMSGGTLVALAADEILMDPNAVLGPLDPQVGRGNEFFPAVSILAAMQVKDHDKLEDSTIILADVSAKAMRQMRDFTYFLLKDKMEDDKAKEIAEVLSSGRWTHDFPLNLPVLKEAGIKVSEQVPDEVYQLMALYPQPSSGEPPVEYTPTPLPEKRQKQ